MLPVAGSTRSYRWWVANFLRPLPGQAIEEGVVLGRQALVIEVVERVAPDLLANGAERPIDAIVVVALGEAGKLAGVIGQPDDLPASR
jgi:hypothetical protein